MQTIQMVDLQAQYQRLKHEIDASVTEVLQSGHYINGPQVGRFREALSQRMGGIQVITCANGTDALQIALMAMGLEPGDEVITTNFTFISTVEVLVLLKLKPVLADVDPQTFNIDPASVERCITKKTRAIIPVHLFGQAAAMDPILEIARRHQLMVLEDNAQALGASYRHHDGTEALCGTIGHISTTSFFPTKPLACYGDGGAIMTHDPQLAEKAAMIANHGARQKYYHEIIGVNSRLDTIQAAILEVNLRHFDAFNEARRRVAEKYNRSFSGIPGVRTPVTAAGNKHVYHQYTLQLAGLNRDMVKAKLNEAGIPAMIYYPVPLSLQKAFESARHRKGDFPVSEKLSETVLSLPIHSEMSDEQIEYIVREFRRIVEGS